MARGSIRGITVQIGGDSTGLQKALSGVDKSIKNTQTSLRDVNRLLKLDPANTELITQKQKLLKEAIEATKTKLDTLKTASEQAAKTASNYDAWKAKHDAIQKEIDETSAHLKELKEKAKDADRQLAEGKISQEKYDALQAEIRETEEKLKDLKDQSKACDEEFGHPVSSDQYDALQREIIETENELKNLQKEAANANSVLANIGEAGKKFESAGNAIAGAGKKMLPVSAAVAGIGAAALKTTGEFDASMSNVSAISGATGKDFDSLRDKAREMGAKTKFSASEAADAMSYMAMAGWKTQDMLDGIGGVMDLAAASGEDLASTSDIVTDALTAFGLTAKDSGHFADILAAASSNANTNVAMMGETFKYAAPVAGALGYRAEVVAVAIGLMGNSGIKASQAGTALRTLMTNMAKPTEAVEGAMKRLGVSLDDGQGNMKSFKEVMDDLRAGFGDLKVPAEKIQEDIDALIEDFEQGKMTEEEFNAECDRLMEGAYGAEGALKAEAAASLAGKTGLSGLLAIVNASPEDYDKLTEAIENCDGVTQQMAQTMQDNLPGQLTILKSQLQELAIQFGDSMMPMVRKAVKAVQDFVDRLNHMGEGQRNAILRIGALVAALGPFLVILGTCISKMGVAMQAFSKAGAAVLKLKAGAGGASGMLAKLGAAIGGISAPVAAVVAAVGVLVAAFVHLWKTNDKFREDILSTWQRIKTAVSGFTSGIAERLGKLGITFSSVAGVMKKAWEGLCSILAPVFNGAFKNIAVILETVLGVLTGLLDVFIGLFTGNWRQAWAGVKEAFASVWEGIKGILKNALETMKGIADAVLGWFGSGWNQAWEAVSTFFQSVWSGIASFFGSIWEGIRSAASAAVEALAGILSGAWEAISSTVSSVWTAISEKVSAAWETIKAVVQVGILFIQELLNAAFTLLTLPWQFIWENFGDEIKSAWETIKKTVSEALKALQDKIKTVWNAIRGFLVPVLNSIRDTFKTTWEAVKTAVSTILDAVKAKVTAVWNAIRSFLTTVLTAIKTAVSNAWTAVKTQISGTVDVIKTKVTAVWNAIRTFLSNNMAAIRDKASTVWTAMKTKIGTVADGIKTKVGSVFDSLKTKVGGVFDGIKSAASSKWESIKSAIIRPVENARDAVKSAIDRMRSCFNFHWSLPHLKLPHVHISGHFSLRPPSAPHFSISWYKEGGIMTKPTMFGINGSSIMAGGEAGPEAVLPLSEFYDRLSSMLDERLNMSGMEKYLKVIADNSERGIFLEDGTLVGHLLPAIDSGLAKYSMRGSRGNR